MKKSTANAEARGEFWRRRETLEINGAAGAQDGEGTLLGLAADGIDDGIDV